MNDHISKPRMVRFCTRALGEEEFAAIARHIADCRACLGLYQEVFRERRDYAPVSFDLSAQWAPPGGHLGYEDLVLYVEGRLRGKAREMTEAHLEACARCRWD